jgi:hypothetical protein
VDSEAVEKRNQEEWHIPEVVLPLPKVQDQDASMIIEVDPAYMEDDD